MSSTTRAHWPKKAVLDLISAVKTANLANIMDKKTTTKRSTYKKVHDTMNEKGYGYSIQQIINKYNKMKGEYQKIEAKLARSGNRSEGRKWEYFMPMHHILGNRPRNATEDEEEDIPYHEFQVMNSNEKKWKANKNQPNQEVSLVKSVRKAQFWRFQREKNEPLWSFHVLSETGKKLYLSYDENNNDITLEFKGVGGKKRFFYILIQNDGNYFFRAQHGKDRYLGSIEENGHHKLMMFTMKHPSGNMVWLVKEDFTQIGSGKSKDVVQVQSRSKNWISQDAKEDQTVKIEQGGVGKFFRQHDGPYSRFSPVENSLLSVSSHVCVNEMLFVSNASTSTRAFQQSSFEWDSGFFKNKYTCKWLAARSGVLCQVDDQKNATCWDVVCAHKTVGENDETQFFPSLSY